MSRPSGPPSDPSGGATEPETERVASEGVSILDAVGEAFQDSRSAAARGRSGRGGRGGSRPAGSDRRTPSPEEGTPPRRALPSPPEAEDGGGPVPGPEVQGEPAAQPVRTMLEDPDPVNRRRAAEALTESREVVRLSDAARALADPDDSVAAAAVEVAARHGARALSALLPVAMGRARPLSQQAALARLPELAADAGEAALPDVLDQVGAMDPAPLPGERRSLGELARALGTAGLIRQLDASDLRRLGAARLLLAEGGIRSLGAVATLGSDPSLEIRRCAALARQELEALARPGATAPAAEESPEAEPAEGELLESLARALTDPAAAVREGAASALRALPPNAVIEWVQGALERGGEPRASAAAVAAGSLRAIAAAPQLLERGAATPPHSRAPFLQALVAVDLDADGLAAALRAVDPSWRGESLRIAWRVAGTALLPHLASFLRDSAGTVRIAALELLAESGDPSATDEARRLQDSDASAPVRAAAAKLVAAVAGREERAEALAAALEDPDPDVRATAVEALPRGSGQEVDELLLRALLDDDERVWRSAIPHLATLPDAAMPILWVALRRASGSKRDELLDAIEATSAERATMLATGHRHDADPKDRSLAVTVAERAGSPAAVEMLGTALRDPDAAVRRAAAAAMAHLRPAGAVEGLAEALADPTPEVRVEVVGALSLIDDDSVPSLLISALRDPEVRVRDSAAEALARWRSPAVARQLAASLTSPDLRRAAAEALLRMGRAARDPLLDVVAGPDPDAARVAARVLEQLAGPEPFVRDLTATDPDRRLRSVEALGSMGGAEAARALVRALADPDPRVRSRAATHLGDLGEPAAAAPLKRMFAGDPVPDVAAAAEAALRKLGAKGGGSSGEPGGHPHRGSGGEPPVEDQEPGEVNSE